MATEKQHQANTLNAQKSTGPKTTAGKARSARNAIQHGCYCTEVVLPWEDDEAYEQLEQSFWDTYNPIDAVEAALVRQMTAAEWKLQRTQRGESHGLWHRGNITNGQERLRWFGKPDHYPAKTKYEKICHLDGRNFNAYTGPVDRLNSYAKAESTIQRNFERAVETLEKRRAQRRKEAIEDAKLGLHKTNPIPIEPQYNQQNTKVEEKAKPIFQSRETRPDREVVAINDKQLVKQEAAGHEKPPKHFKNG